MRYPGEGASESEILEADAVQLLLTSLQRSRPGYKPETHELSPALQICQQVQGMPLGIILAASWGVTLSVDGDRSEGQSTS